MNKQPIILRIRHSSTNEKPGILECLAFVSTLKRCYAGLHLAIGFLALKTMKVKKLIFLIGTLGSLVGCTGLSPDRYLANKHSFMIGRGDPPAYVSGYVDGCSSGRRLAGEKRFVYRKNELRFEKDALYARGWQEGQINCRNEVLSQGLGMRSDDDHIGQTVKEDRKRRMESEDRSVDAEMREIWEALRK